MSYLMGLVAYKIKRRSEALGLLQKDVSKMTGIGQVQLSILERGGRHIKAFDELPRLAKALQVPIMWFYEGIEQVEDVGINMDEVVQ